jgi:hypothetical protein
MESKRSWKAALMATMVKEQLSFARVPVIGDTGKIANFASNADQKRYVIFDSHRDAPGGFCVAVISSRAEWGARVMKATIGDCRELPLIQAREMAKVAWKAMRTTQRTPAEARDVVKEDFGVAAMAVAECLAMYRKQLRERAKPAKDGSLRGLAQALKRICRSQIDLGCSAVGELITEKRLLEGFDTRARGRRTLAAAPADPDSKPFSMGRPPAAAGSLRICRRAG